jgi:hypothetical protein
LSGLLALDRATAKLYALAWLENRLLELVTIAALLWQERHPLMFAQTAEKLTPTVVVVVGNGNTVEVVVVVVIVGPGMMVVVVVVLDGGGATPTPIACVVDGRLVPHAFLARTLT